MHGHPVAFEAYINCGCILGSPGELKKNIDSQSPTSKQLNKISGQRTKALDLLKCCQSKSNVHREGPLPKLIH